MAVVGNILNISWKETPEPNDFSWNYTVSLTDQRADDELFSDVLLMNGTQLNTNIILGECDTLHLYTF